MQGRAGSQEALSGRSRIVGEIGCDETKGDLEEIDVGDDQGSRFGLHQRPA